MSAATDSLQAKAYEHVYVWGNNSKRARLKGQKCRVISYGAKRTCMVEFEGGAREIIDRYALRRVVE